MIEILRTGPFLTVQDLGRKGYMHLGVSQAGALDWLGLQQANLLLGNPPDAAGFEITVGPIELQFKQDAHVVLMGSDFKSTLDDLKIYSGFVVKIRAGQILTLLNASGLGARAYLAVAGGIDVPVVLGSRSTDLNSAFGGFNGRMLRAGDTLQVGQPAMAHKDGDKKGIRLFGTSPILRAITGPEYELFSDESKELFWKSPWKVSPQSNRMGCRLIGPKLSTVKQLSLLSAGVLPGVVQVPPDGQPIILCSDAQTVGGYPKIASLVSTDLRHIAYLPLNSEVRFEQISIAEAAIIQSEQQQYLQQLTTSLHKNYEASLED